MPIRASEKARYPKDWADISQMRRWISDYRCECVTECGLHPWGRCVERHNRPAFFAKGRVILTVAHLNHRPEDCSDDNLRAMCQRCHLRYDAEHHAANARKTRDAKSKQMRLL